MKFKMAHMQAASVIADINSVNSEAVNQAKGGIIWQRQVQ
jgi:hypothetical protein